MWNAVGQHVMTQYNGKQGDYLRTFLASDKNIFVVFIVHVKSKKGMELKYKYGGKERIQLKLNPNPCISKTCQEVFRIASST